MLKAHPDDCLQGFLARLAQPPGTPKTRQFPWPHSHIPQFAKPRFSRNAWFSYLSLLILRNPSPPPLHGPCTTSAPLIHSRLWCPP